MRRAHEVVVAGDVDGMHLRVSNDSSDDPSTKATNMTPSAVTRT